MKQIDGENRPDTNPYAESENASFSIDDVDPQFSYYPKTVDEAARFYINEPKKPGLLLHTCCAPCASGILDGLIAAFDVTIFFYNPCIMPNEEFKLRLGAINALLCNYPQVKLIVPEQSEREFIQIAKKYSGCPEGGERCALCFEQRLSVTAEFCACRKSDYDFFATTLTVSPHKNAELINQIGDKAARKYDTRYLISDFKKRDGYLNSVKNSKKFNLYRQTYCGCLFSKINIR